MGLTDIKSWDEAARAHGIVPITLVLMIIINAALVFLVIKQVPAHLSAIAAGYERNAHELTTAADKFSSAAMDILAEYKRDRIADQHLMVELIRRGAIDSATVADSIEAAAEKANTNGDG